MIVIDYVNTFTELLSE